MFPKRSPLPEEFWMIFRVFAVRHCPPQGALLLLGDVYTV